MAYSVLPIIDLQTGQVQFKVQGRWYTRYVDRPAQLERLVARAARRPVFDPANGELIVFIAAAGIPAGRQSAFSLAKFPTERTLAKLGG
ncbi:hypothetical protein [Glutamicibacter sp.]|uniref:hypothetical protein n=1 Tax=Glutamicibacter sp. TaxID=1931995 RepID=UPI0028BF1A82|nr:hypothetical protein [Glutamicibacter sp.]